MSAPTRTTALAILVAASAVLSGCTSTLPPSAAPPSRSAGPSPSASAHHTTDPSAGPPSSPAPRPSPTPRPSSTPDADVSAAFTRKMTAPTFEGAGPISGTMKVGAFEGTISGSLVLKGADTAYDLTMTIPGVATETTSATTVAGRSYTASNGGPWFELDTTSASGDNPAAVAFARASMRVEDHGVVLKLGRRLHRLVPSGAQPTGTELGFGDAYRDTRASIEFYARDDGTLAVMSIGIRGLLQQGGSIPVEIAMDFAFDGSVPASMKVPDDVWTRFTSRRFHYSIGVPSGWTTEPSTSATKPDVFVSPTPGGSVVLIERQPKAAANNLNGYVRAFIRAEKRLGHRVLANEAVKVLGRPARRLVIKASVNGNAVTVVFTLLVRGRDAYEIGTAVPERADDAVLALHELQVGTFQLTGR